MGKSRIKPTELSFAGQVISWIMEQISHGGLPFRNALNDASLYGLPTAKFPDVLLTLDDAGEQPFCSWELKTPSTDVRDSKLLANAVEKARVLKVNYFVTWNMSSAIIWQTPSRGPVEESHKRREYGPIPQISSAADIQDKVKYLRLKELCARLLLDLGRLYDDASVNLNHADTTVFVSMLSKAAEDLWGPIYEAIKKQRSNRQFDSRLEAWAKKQGVNKYDTNFYKTLARQVVYRLIAKILFYQTLRRYRLDLPVMKLEGTPPRQLASKLADIFQKARDVDFQAVFEPDITDEIQFTRPAADVLIELVGHLNEYTFEQMPLDVIGRVFEQLIPPEVRHSLGQYFTREDLVDFIIAFCVRNHDDHVLDPTCGTGTFLIRAYDRLKRMADKSHHELLTQLWGVDIARFPAQLTTINLFRQNLADYRNFPRIVSKDFFEVAPGDEFDFPPPRVGIDVSHTEKEKIPVFDAIVGNFPYIRQELIERSNRGYKEQLKRVLWDDWRRDYPQLFQDHELSLSGQADIYAYLFFHTAVHLKVGGRMGIVVSNAWLNVAYGYELQKFFLNKFKIIAIVESRCEPWFEDVAINTVFVILERCDDADQRDEHRAKFVKLKKPLAEIFPQDLAIDAARRWSYVQELVDRIEGIGPANSPAARQGAHKIFGPVNSKYVKLPEIDSYEDSDIRVRAIRQGDLRTQVETADRTVKWGPHLRAPDVYFDLLQTCADKLVPLGEVAEVRRGITTGINEFFYLTPEQIKHWKIEKQFLKPVIRSSKECPSLIVNEKNLKYKVFCCNKPKSQLAGTNALRYIRWGERKLPGSGKRWSDVPSVQGRPNWYTLPLHEPGPILMTRIDNDCLRAISNPDGTLVDCNLAEITPNDKSLTKGLLVYLNSNPAFLQRELLGRANLGDGALKFEVMDFPGIMVPNADVLRRLERACGKDLDRIARRSVPPISKQKKDKTRQAINIKLLELLGYGRREAKKVAEELADGVSLLVYERLNLPKSRKRRIAAREKRDIEQLVETVEQKVLPNGVRRFPEAFVRGRVAWEDVPVPSEPLRIGDHGIGVCQMVLPDETVFTETSFDRARAICYAQRNHPGELVVKIPRNEIARLKALKDYVKYVQQVREELYRTFMALSGEVNLSENLTNRVLEEYGLDLSD